MILLDACVPRKFQRLLKAWGYDAGLITDHLQSDAPDADVIKLAQELDAVLLTVDLDFSHIFDYPPGDYAGIVVMRYHVTQETQIIESLKQAVDELYRDELRGALVIVESGRYRIRR
jgi:predicted nuclease of predicted toxin-antitoxin system